MGSASRAKSWAKSQSTFDSLRVTSPKPELGNVDLDGAEIRRAMSLIDARLVDIWKAADEGAKQKAIRILSELLWARPKTD